ncbi:MULTISPECIES: HlyD family efflux transporter periplasmic adaptor subunit [unclassified Dysgonomonas]|jgi:HlyD family secretion protein|uniref:HlyD family secretion protein n=1 Tax=unclassified Dysgonomonas TaxID=2630389 RepID=UPI0025C719DB|nr:MULTISPECIES: HlyD family efflux transporter periplasmic adaptor subunit [unclassified Dysgonomonas]MDR2002091.1 HlyD family efflux transporter periplasmic adaptor subunit [Prevotella sp.]HMM02624.1 HlyD family efflux transporter periplasmic adaptor subunit [Dysgonomonas sp.]
MNTIKNILFLCFAILLSACDRGKGDYDASGVFETTEVIVSAEANGKIMQFDIEEGQLLDAGREIGYIDTVQLYLKKMQLQANMKSVKTRYTDVPRQIAATKQQIATQRNELKRFENLVKSNAANQKQVDDINAQILVLERQLAAQTETLENSNRGVSEESTGLDIQVAQLNDQLQKSIITSPIRGTVLSKYAEQGELATQGRALFKIADMDNMFLRAYITSGQLTEVKIGQQVRVFADFGEKDIKEYAGTITWISDKSEFTPKTIQTRDERANLVYAVKIAVKNDGYLKKGMYGELKLN